MIQKNLSMKETHRQNRFYRTNLWLPRGRGWGKELSRDLDLASANYYVLNG